MYCKHNYEINNYFISVTLNEKNPSNNKPKIIIISRINPNHNCSSFIIQGLIDNLISNDNICVEFLLNNYEIIIIPFFSYEMVIFGNNIHSIEAINNNDWKNSNYNNSKENQYLIKLLLHLKKSSEIEFLIEFHDSFFEYDYYLNIYNDINNQNESIDFINILSYNMNFFDLSKTWFFENSDKYSKLKKDFNIPFIMKFYTSTFGNDKKDIWFLLKDFKNIGKNFLYCLSLFAGKINNNIKDKNIQLINLEIDDFYKANPDYKYVYKKEEEEKKDHFFLKDTNLMKKNINFEKWDDENNEILNLIDNKKIEDQEENTNKLMNNYFINHKRDLKTKNYDYVVRRDKNNKFEIKNKDAKFANIKKNFINYNIQKVKHKVVKNKIYNFSKIQEIKNNFRLHSAIKKQTIKKKISTPIINNFKTNIYFMNSGTFKNNFKNNFINKIKINNQKNYNLNDINKLKKELKNIKIINNNNMNLTNNNFVKYYKF